MTVVESGSSAPQPYGGGQQSTNLGDILTRVLDKGVVIAGDIQINLLDIELLTIKLRLVVASLETAKAVGIDWWETDPWLSGRAVGQASGSQEGDLELENQQLRERIAELESGRSRKAVGSASKPRRKPAGEVETASKPRRRPARDGETAPRPRRRPAGDGDDG